MKILIVDDEPTLREFFAEILKRKGFETLKAADGVEGLKIFNQEHPEIVFTDIQMPNMNGLDFLSEIRKKSLETIVIIITGLGSEEMTLEALRRRANDFLRKPVQPKVLFPIIEKYKTIMEDKTKFEKTKNFFIQKNFSVELENNLEIVPEVVKRLMSETWDSISEEKRLGVRLGLLELIVNAIEHGNLGISYEEKKAAMEESFEGLESLISQRLENSAIAQRRVLIDFYYNKTSCTWTITDEGEGFNWRSLPDPTDPQNILCQNGRGIFLARMSFDNIKFNETGNSVKLEIKI